MRTIRRRNWFIKRIALGFAVAVFAAPVAQARVDEGSIAQAKAESSIVEAHTYQPVQANGYHAFITDFPSSRVQAPSISDPRIEFVRTHPLSASPELVASRFGHPNATTGTELEAVNWQDVGIGAGFALALVLVSGAAMLATRHAGREQTA
jgi:hypothetical protein